MENKESETISIGFKLFFPITPDGGSDYNFKVSREWLYGKKKKQGLYIR